MRKKILKISNYLFEFHFKKITNKISKEKEFLILENKNDIINWGEYQSAYFDNAYKLMWDLRLKTVAKGGK